MSYGKISSCISITYAAVLQTPFSVFAVLLTLSCVYFFLQSKHLISFLIILRVLKRVFECYINNYTCILQNILIVTWQYNTCT